MSLNNLTVQRQFEVDPKRENAAEFIEESKKALEEDAQQELDKKMGNTLVDFQMWPSWTVENADGPDSQIHTLTMKVVFKP
ncbi:MAG: hypothetical protein EOP10_18345 [Proteobacteria bacterium]|nr:MAG: hypothetical protein EOP10_18345 [Pseudomonadota bacterium]